MHKDDVRSWEIAVSAYHNRVAALALLLWDFLLTFEDERTLFWNKSRTWVTYLFFWNRYNGLLVTIIGAVVLATPDLSDKLCGSWLRLEGWLGITSTWSVEVILQLRIYALYNRSKVVAFVMVTGFSAQVIFVLCIMGFGSREGEVYAVRWQNLQRCKVTHIPPWTSLLWVALTAYECLLFSLTLYKCIQYYRSRDTIPIAVRSIRNVILLDAVVYSFLTGVIYIANLVVWNLQLQDTLYLITGMAIAFPCLMGSRLMINVRAHAEPLTYTNVTPSDISLPTMTDLGRDSIHVNLGLPELDFR